MTKYRVLRRTEQGYEVVSSEIEANGAVQAIRKAAEADGVDEGGATFVAVPVSTWTEEPVAMLQPPPRLKVGVAAAQTTIDEVIEEETAAV